MSAEPTFVWMARDNLDALPDATLPAGYRIRPYRTGDASIWMALVRQTILGEMFPDASFEKEFPGDETLRERRILFAEDRSGDPVGTITAWHGKEGPDAGWGLVHWFAILPAHRNRGLGRALLARALRTLAAFHTGVVVTSEISLTAALRLYLDAGFDIGINHTEDRLAWRKVAGVLNHPGLDALLDPPPADPAPAAVVEQLKIAAIPLAGCGAGQGFDDLKPLAKVIGGARIVSMGEATHGTREFFRMKHRLLEYLVEEHGFTAFAIEASFPECVMLDRFVTTGEGDPLDGITNMRFWTWNTEEVRDLVLWLRRHNERAARPVRFYGFDMQSPAMAVRDVILNLRRWHPDLAAALAVRLAPLTDDFRGEGYGTLPADRQADVTAALRESAEAIRSATGMDPRERTMAELHATVARQGEEYLRLGYPGGFRDHAMAENLCALLDLEGTDGRIAAWAHNLHVSKAGSDSMGSHLHRRDGSRHVVMGFAFGHGSFQAADQSGGTGLRDFTVPPPPPGSLDDALLRTGLPVFALNPGGMAPASDAGRWLSVARPTRSIGSVFSEDTDGPSWFVQSRPIGESYDVLIFIAETAAARPNPDERRLPARERRSTVPSPTPEYGTVMDHGLPRGWLTRPAARRPNYEVIVRDGQASLRRDGVPWEYDYGMLDQPVAAGPFRGKRVRLVAEGKAAVAGEWSHALLGLAAGKGRKPWLFNADMLAFTATWHDPWTRDIWETRAVQLTVPDEAESLLIVFVLSGNGMASIRNIRIEPGI